MGAPKKHRRNYDTPKKPYDRARIEKERKILREFGLRRKKEIWKAESILRNFRQRARELQARREEIKEKALFEKLNKMGIGCSKLEDILVISLEDILSRRLQTIVYKKGFASTPLQARQFIVHGHIFVDGRKTVWPSYIVQKEEEDKITISKNLVKNKIKES